MKRNREVRRLMGTQNEITVNTDELVNLVTCADKTNERAILID